MKPQKGQEDKIEKLTEKLEAGIKEVFASGRYREYLSTMQKFHNYSYNNSMLILLQKPEASYVAGYKTWETLERQTVKTAIHETAHSILHKDKVHIKDSATMEVEAESVAFICCQHLGLDTSDYSFGYLAGWSSDKELPELKSSLQTIQRTTHEVIENHASTFSQCIEPDYCRLEQQRHFVSMA